MCANNSTIIQGDTPSFLNEHVKCFGTYDAKGGKLSDCRSWGRYLTIQSRKTGVELSIVEIAVHTRPIGRCLSKQSKMP